jgi:nitrous oxidase accessory protein
MGPALAASVLLVWVSAGALQGAERVVRPDGSAAVLQEAIDAAQPGDTIRLSAGEYRGGLIITKALRLVGEDWPVIDSGGVGTVIDIRAEGVVLEGLVVRGSGASLDQENSGIAIQAARAEVRGNRLEDVLFGIYLRKASNSVVVDNEIRGKDLDLPRRGDAIRIWYSNDVELERNRIEGSRDVVLWYSDRLSIRDNRVQNGRYGLHFMYCDDAHIEHNLLADNSVGGFLMYSRRLRMIGNTITGNHGPSGYGVGLKDMDDAVVRGNFIFGNRVGVFLDNSPREVTSSSLVEGNVLLANDFGILMLPNVRRATFRNNGLVENQEQVGMAGAGGDPSANLWEGNYWSDYVGYDADGDGVGDVPYLAQRLFEDLAMRKPALRLFHFSPASEALDFAARAFPIVRPKPKLEDRVPSMDLPVITGMIDSGREVEFGLAPAAAGMLGLAALLLAVPALVRRLAFGAKVQEMEPGQARQEEAMIRVQGLTKSFGDQLALDDVSFSVSKGEAVALWGPNGAGKTTAIRALLGVMPVVGRVEIDGIDAALDGKRARGRIGFVPQEVPLQADLTVVETLDFYGRLRRCELHRTEELIEELDLVLHADKKVKHLSGGLRQRLALGVALLADPEILLFDEPSANLDDGARRAFLEVLLKLRGDKTIIFSTHRRGEVYDLADRVLVLVDGKLVADGTPAETLGRDIVAVDSPADEQSGRVLYAEGGLYGTA